MKYVGADLHKKTIVLCVLDKERNVLQRVTLHCHQPDAVRSFFAKLAASGPCKVVVEATASYEWLAEILDQLKIELVLAHPGKLRLIAESTNKTDKVDAKVLAEFLALDFIPRAYRPTKRQREHRVLVRHRVAVRQQCSRIKCQVRRVLSNYNADRKDVFSALGREEIRKKATAEFAASDRFVLEQLLRDLDHMETQLAKATKQLREFAEAGDAKEARAREVLRSAPGVGETVSEVVLAELGDVERFASIDQVTAYAGLAPGKRESAGKSKDLGITKQGSKLLRWAMVQAAWQSIRSSLKWSAIYERLKKRRGAKRAIIAVARRLLRVLASMWKNGEEYRFGPNERPRGEKPKKGGKKAAQETAKETTKTRAKKTKAESKPNQEAATV